MVTFFLLKLLSYWFSSCVCCLLPMAYDILHSVLMLQHVNFAFNFNVQHAMKVFLFRLINICWSFHCFCFVANLKFPPLTDIILYFWMNLTSAVFLYFSLFNFACTMASFSYLEYCETSCPLVHCLPFACYRSQVKC